MTPIDSTAEILIWKHLNKSVDEKWVDWAYEMLQAGFDGEYLIELAGINKPYNEFELQELTSKAFDELKLDYSNREKIIYDYVLYLERQIIENKREVIQALRVLKDICIEMDMKENIFDFYLLYFAKEDTSSMFTKEQSYWKGADKDNIDKVVLEYFEEWRMRNKI